MFWRNPAAIFNLALIAFAIVVHVIVYIAAPGYRDACLEIATAAWNLIF